MDLEERLGTCFYHPCFKNRKKILSPLPDIEIYEKRKSKIIEKSDEKRDQLQSIQVSYEEPLLTFEQEQHLFKQYNYFKYCAIKHLNAKHTRQAKEQIAKADKIRQQLVLSNTRLVISVVKSYYQNPDSHDENLSNGYLDLFNIIDKFDWRKGFKFSTYATWAIRNSLFRRYGDQQKHSSRYYELQEYHDEPVGDYNEPLEFDKNVIKNAIRRVKGRDRQIIKDYYGFNRKREAFTTDEIAEKHKISYERVRQVFKRAKYKLTKELTEELDYNEVFNV